MAEVDGFIEDLVIGQAVPLDLLSEALLKDYIHERLATAERRAPVVFSELTNKLIAKLVEDLQDDLIAKALAASKVKERLAAHDAAKPLLLSSSVRVSTDIGERAHLAVHEMDRQKSIPLSRKATGLPPEQGTSGVEFYNSGAM